MSNWGTVAIGTRIGEGRCDPLFFRSWTRLVTGGMRAGDVVLDPAIELPHHMAANILVQNFLQSGADTLCMVDSDMVFAPDTLSKMRDNKEGGIYDTLSALSVSRRAPFAPIALQLQEKDGASEYRCCAELITGGVIDVDAVSLAFCLIRKSVFVALAKYAPWWFDWGERGLGEDTRFTLRMHEAGSRAGVHTGISIEHRGMIGFVWDVEQKKTRLTEFNQVRQLIKT